MWRVPILIAVLSVGAAAAAAQSQWRVPAGCVLSGGPAWSDQVRNVIADCDLKLPSPDGKLTLHIDGEGHVSVSLGAEPPSKDIRRIEAPAMASWSPASSAFFINDGEGSGQSSVFWLFRISRGVVAEDGTVHRGAVAAFRQTMKCKPEANDPYVWGFGWSSDGAQVYLLVQDEIHQPCGRNADFICLVVDIASGKIVERLPEAATKRRFRALLPRELFTR